MAEAAAARQQAEYDRLIAEKENQCRQQEAEEELRHEQTKSQHDLDMAILTANKMQAIADAKLKAIELSIREEETPRIPFHEDACTITSRRTQE